MDKAQLESLVREVLVQKLGGAALPAHGVRAVRLPQVLVTEADRMDTGRACDRVYTHDLFSLAESPRMGAGIMEMEHTTFPWTLHYDEMDYIIEGRLDIVVDHETISVGPGELIYIPKNSVIQFSVPDRARFLYFVYPADWQNQG